LQTLLVQEPAQDGDWFWLFSWSLTGGQYHLEGDKHISAFYLCCSVCSSTGKP